MQRKCISGVYCTQVRSITTWCKSGVWLGQLRKYNVTFVCKLFTYRDASNATSTARVCDQTSSTSSQRLRDPPRQPLVYIFECMSDETWEKVLWKPQAYPDNYIPERYFLASLRKNRQYPVLLASFVPHLNFLRSQLQTIHVLAASSRVMCNHSALGLYIHVPWGLCLREGAIPGPSTSSMDNSGMLFGGIYILGVAGISRRSDWATLASWAQLAPLSR